MRQKAIDRFNRKFTKVDDCWIWTASTNSDGYGTFWNGYYRISAAGKASPVIMLAHRWSYQHFNGPVPDGLYVLHSCDNQSCVNPEHLSLGTQAENVRQCAVRGRRNQSRERKLTAEKRAEIKRRYTGAYGQQTALAREYGVSQATVYSIVGGRAAVLA